MAAIDPSDEVKALLAKVRKISNEINTMKKLMTDELYNLGANYSSILKHKNALHQHLSELPKEGKINSLIEEWLNDIDDKLRETEKTLIHNFLRDLEARLDEEGLKIEGHIPNLSVSLFTLVIDKEALKASLWYGNKQEKIGSYNLNAEMVSNEIVKNLKKLKESEFNSREFLKALYRSYEAARVVKGKSPGERVPISEVLMQLILLRQPDRFYSDPTERNFKEYRRMEFSYDLHRLDKRELDEHLLSLVTATRAYTGKRQDFIWVPSGVGSDGNYISHIQFKESKP